MTIDLPFKTVSGRCPQGSDRIGYCHFLRPDQIRLQRYEPGPQTADYADPEWQTSGAGAVQHRTGENGVGA